MRIGPFKPSGTSSTIAVTATSQRVALSQGNSAESVYLSNVGASECFIAFGDATVTATAGGSSTSASDGSMAIPAGFYGVISNVGQSNIAAVCAASNTTTLRVTPGTGE
jgi:hypothetical protein